MLEQEKSGKIDWAQLRFDEIAVNATERAEPSPEDNEKYVGLEHLESGSLRVRRWGAEVALKGTKLKMREGDILFARRNAYLKRVALAPHDGLFSAHGLVLRPNPEAILSEFLPYFMQSDVFMDRAISISVGSLSPTINWKALSKEKFALPPIHEQARLVESFAASRSLSEALQDAIIACERTRTALRQHLFSGEAEEGLSISTALGELPQSWRVQSLSECFELLDNQRIPLKESDRSKRQGPYTYYGASGPIDTIDDYIFDEPTILLAEDGMNLVFRNAPIAIKATGRYWVNNHAHVLRPRSGANIDFYLEYLNHISLMPYITGTDQKKITKANCEKIPLVVPPPHRQEEISSVFLSFAEKQALLLKRLEAANATHRRLLEESVS